MSLEALTGLDQLGLPQQGRGGIKRKEREMATEAGAIAVVAWRGLLGEGPGWPCGSPKGPARSTHSGPKLSKLGRHHKCSISLSVRSVVTEAKTVHFSAK